MKRRRSSKLRPSQSSCDSGRSPSITARQSPPARASSLPAATMVRNRSRSVRRSSGTATRLGLMEALRSPAIAHAATRPPSPRDGPPHPARRPDRPWSGSSRRTGCASSGAIARHARIGPRIGDHPPGGFRRDRAGRQRKAERSVADAEHDGGGANRLRRLTCRQRMRPPSRTSPVAFSSRTEIRPPLADSACAKGVLDVAPIAWRGAKCCAGSSPPGTRPSRASQRTK